MAFGAYDLWKTFNWSSIVGRPLLAKNGGTTSRRLIYLVKMGKQNNCEIIKKPGNAIKSDNNGRISSKEGVWGTGACAWAECWRMVTDGEWCCGRCPSISHHANLATSSPYTHATLLFRSQVSSRFKAKDTGTHFHLFHSKSAGRQKKIHA